jgi:transposase
MATPRKKPEDYLKRGRPTDYRPEYCEIVYNHMAQGYSLTAAAGHIGQSHDALWNWAQKYPEFAEAVKRGKAARTEILERELLTLGGNKDGARVTARIFALKNAAPHEWKDQVQVDQRIEVTEIRMKVVNPTPKVIEHED